MHPHHLADSLRPTRSSRSYSTLFGRPVDWESEVTVGVGATETLFATMHALLDEGDEAVLISPSFDIYASQVVLAGGVCRFVPLRVASDAAQPGKQGARARNVAAVSRKW